MEWDERKHPRDEDGKFTDKDGDLGKSENKFKNFKNPHKKFGRFGKNIDNGKGNGYNKKDADMLCSSIKSGKRYSYEELLKTPTIQYFERKNSEAIEKVKIKQPLSEQDKEKYSNRFLQGVDKIPKQFRADIVIGLPAAGKSTAVVNSLKQKYGSFEFDNDEIKKLLPGYDELGASYVHKSSQEVQEYAFNAFRKGQILNGANLAIPIVGSKIKSVDSWIMNLQTAGYEVHVHHVGISNIESLNRATARAIETGRYVPLSKIYEYGEKPKEVYEQLKKEGRKEVIFE